MTLKKAFSAAALGLSLISAVPAQATTITNADGLFSWTGFDWAQAGTAYTTGFTPVANDTFTIDAFAVAVALQNGSTVLSTPGLDATANGVSTGYEYTLHVLLNETVDTCNVGGTSCSFNVLSGSYSIFYDAISNANADSGSLGTGFLDGALLISGTVFAQPGGTFTVAGGGGIGIAQLFGSVVYTDLTYINQALSSTVAVTTLQLGNATTNNWVSPGGFNSAPFTQNNIVFQADANQSFSAVPEPASLALFGIAMLAGGAATRRRIKK